MELMIETGGYIYDITELCTELSWTDTLNNGAGSLEFSYIYDGMLIENGAPVRLTDKEQTENIFFGTVFRVETDQGGTVKVKAYDRLRYCKTKDTLVVEGDTLNTLVQKMCSFFTFPVGENTRTGYVLPTGVYTDKTWLDIIYTGISDTLMGTEHEYCLRDENGSLCLRDLADLQLPLVLGDESFTYEYSYSKSIEDDFYNQIKLVAANENTGRADVIMNYDIDSIQKYGLLQYYEKLSGKADPARTRDKADKLLRLYNREKETMSFGCFGDRSVRAGCSIYGSVQDIRLNKRLIVNRVVHKFLPVYTMEVEVLV